MFVLYTTSSLVKVGIDEGNCLANGEEQLLTLMPLSILKWQVQVYPFELGQGTGNTEEENENCYDTDF